MQAPRGAKRIELDVTGRPRTLVNDVSCLGFHDAALPRMICAVAYVSNPERAVELRTEASEVFVQDKFGALRMLRARSRAFLKRGEVLFLAWSKARGTRFGYVLECDDGDGRVAGAGEPGGGAEVIDVASEEEAEQRDGRRDARTGGVNRARSVSPAKRGSGMGGPSSEDVLEVDSDSPEWRQRKASNGGASPSARAGSDKAKAKGSNANKSAFDNTGRPKNAPRAAETSPHDFVPPHQDAPPAWGGQDANEARRQADASRIPPHPPEGLPDDPEELKSARTSLKQAHRQLVDALNNEVAMRQTLAQCQLDFQRTMRGRADFSIRQWHKDNLSMVAGKYQQSQFAAAAARGSYQQALRFFNDTVQRIESMRNFPASPTRAGARESESSIHYSAADSAHDRLKQAFETECQAWDELLGNEPAEMSLKSLRMVATNVGIDTTTLVERGDFVAALEKKKQTGRKDFEERKRKREAELNAVEEQRKARRVHEEEESAKREAVQQVSIWSTHADLRLFLHRCGVTIDQHGRSTKRLLAKAYRQAMLKYHPDRARQKSTREQALASEVTKWLTHAWQSVPP